MRGPVLNQVLLPNGSDIHYIVQEFGGNTEPVGATEGFLGEMVSNMKFKI